jgi:VanZ family protein
MQRDAYLATFFWILVVLWMAFIFYCSAQPATQSKDLSSGLTDFVVQAMNRWLPAIKVNTECLHGFLRKLAHFVIYLLLGVLVTGYEGKRYYGQESYCCQFAYMRLVCCFRRVASVFCA